MHTAKSVAIGVAALTVVAALTSPDHLLVFCVGATLAVGIWLLWPETDAPILLLPFGLQWLSVAVKPIQTAITGQPLANFADYSEPLLPAAWFGLAGVTVLGLGMWLGLGRSRSDWAKTLARDTRDWPQATVLQISLFLIIAGHLLVVVAYHTGPARQILLAFADARHAGLFLLAYWCLLQGKSLALLGVVVVFEIVFGLTGFFADFRKSLLVLLAAAAAARPRLSITSLVGVGAVMTVILGVTIFWSAIKMDYRDYLNEGTEQQVVLRPMSERLSYVGKAADEFTNSQFDKGLKALIARVSYIDMLACTLVHVPEVVPHENGMLLGQTMLNMAEPRILFPDKAPTPNDSEVTAHYTGLDLDLNSDTSISIGWLGELYIDFGYLGGVVGAFMIGLFGGRAYGILRGYQGIPLFFTYGIATMSMLPLIFFEFDLVRFLGSAVTVFLACLVLQRLIAPQVLLALANREARAHAT